MKHVGTHSLHVLWLRGSGGLCRSAVTPMTVGRDQIEDLVLGTEGARGGGEVIGGGVEPSRVAFDRRAAQRDEWRQGGQRRVGGGELFDEELEELDMRFLEL